jgi:hypothetical protein
MALNFDQLRSGGIRAALDHAADAVSASDRVRGLVN